MKSLNRSIILALISILIITACQPENKESKLMNEIVTKSNITDLFKKLREDKDFRTLDFEFFTNGMTRLVTMNVDSLLGKSVREIIDMQENFERDKMAATAANQATRIELVMNHAFNYVGFKPTEVEDINKKMKDINVLVFDITNKSDKEMVNIEGVIQFYNQNNEIVKVYPVIAKNALKDETIKANETKRISQPFNFDPNNERDKTFRNDHQNLRSVWICSKIEFKDGTKIDVTNTL